MEQLEEQLHSPTDQCLDFLHVKFLLHVLKMNKISKLKFKNDSIKIYSFYVYTLTV